VSVVRFRPRHQLPEHLPQDAQAVLRTLKFNGNARGRNPPEHWFSTLRDAPRAGFLRPEVAEWVAYLRTRKQALPSVFGG